MPSLEDRGFVHPVASEITPRDVYEGRRTLLLQMAVGGAGLALGIRAHAQVSGPGKLPKLAGARSAVSGAATMEKLTAYQDVTTYNNFYEFGTDKADPAARAHTLKTRPWTVAVEGAVSKPRTFDIDELMKLAPMEERVYRLRCVEGWSMVVPWVGWSLASLVREVQPTGNAKFVEFVSLADKAQMPGVRSSVLEWPYVEGLRMDEALHPLTILALGLYGEVLPNQNGAPLRLVVPWKYGFKGIKSIVKIRFMEKQPVSSWQRQWAAAYGFYANVNPTVDHPDWSQATEARLPSLFKNTKTLLFNGYGEEVASLYSSLDLRKNY